MMSPNLTFLSTCTEASASRNSDVIGLVMTQQIGRVSGLMRRRQEVKW